MAFHLKNYLEEQRKRVDAALDKLLPSETTPPPTIHKAMRYSLFAGGKRLRPVLCLAAAEACGENGEAAIPLACAVECIHTYSLVHDDLPSMDDDDLRRGRPTNHKVFGEGIAVLAGDALLTIAFEMCSKTRPSKTANVGDYVAELAHVSGSKELIGGQVEDLEGEGKPVTPEALRHIHEHKTAALLRGSIRLGAMAGGASKDQLEKLTTFGHDIGLAFQIIDDILDATSTKEVMGKSVRADEKNEKATYPKIWGLEPARAEARRLTDHALEALAPFGSHAVALREIATYMLARTN